MRKAMPGPGKLKEEKVGTVLEGSLLLEELLSLVGRLSTYVGLRGGAMSKSAGMIWLVDDCYRYLEPVTISTFLSMDLALFLKCILSYHDMW